MKALVNENCIGCGLCVTICPDVFAMQDSGVAKASQENVPNDGEDMVIEAKTNCPATAIETWED